ncbi:MAG: cytidine deaminase [Marmoricola sp.]
MSELQPEDHKLVVLARAAQARTGGLEGAALRDLDGRTYAASTVDLPALHVSAVGVVVAMAVTSGAGGAEAVVVLSKAPVDGGDLAALRDLAGEGVPVHRVDRTGTIMETTAT